MRFSEAEGRRVIARDTAEQLGAIKRFLLDPPTGSVQAIHIGDRGGDAELVDWTSIVAFGEDAVIVASASAVRPVGSEREQRFAKGNEDLKNKRVLSDHGDELGKLQDVEFDEQSGRISQLVLKEQELPVEGLVAVGPYAVIVPALHRSQPAA